MITLDQAEYKIYYPGGNTTALVADKNYTAEERRTLNGLIMEKHPAVEQVGFLDRKGRHLEMAGGEFCLNAARCAAFELSEGRETVSFTESGMTVPLNGKISDKEVSVSFTLDRSMDELVSEKDGLSLISLDGILISVMDEPLSSAYITQLKSDAENTKLVLKKLMEEKLQTDEKAVGLMLLERKDGKICIHPVVWVKDIDTVFYETACGSGSLGTAIYNYMLTGRTEAEIVQPSGYSLKVRLDVEDETVKAIAVSGHVELLA